MELSYSSLASPAYEAPSPWVMTSYNGQKVGLLQSIYLGQCMQGESPWNQDQGPGHLWAELVRGTQLQQGADCTSGAAGSIRPQSPTPGGCGVQLQTWALGFPGWVTHRLLA